MEEPTLAIRHDFSAARWLWGLAAGMLCYGISWLVLFLLFSSLGEFFRYLGDTVIILVLVLAPPLVAGFVSGDIDRLSWLNFPSATIIGASPVLYAMSMPNGLLELPMDPLSRIAFVLSAFIGRILATRSTSRTNVTETQPTDRNLFILAALSWLLIPYFEMLPLFAFPIVAAGGILIIIVAGLVTKSCAATWIGVVPVLFFALVFVISTGNRKIDRERRGKYYVARTAASNLRTINTAQANYFPVSGETYGTIEELIQAMLLDPRFSGELSFYHFSTTVLSNGQSYITRAEPSDKNSGRYVLYSMPDGVVRYSTDPAWAPKDQAGLPVQ